MMNEDYENYDSLNDTSNMDEYVKNNIMRPESFFNSAMSWFDFIKHHPSIIFNEPTTLEESGAPGSRAQYAIRLYDDYLREKQAAIRGNIEQGIAPSAVAEDYFSPVNVNLGGGQYMKLSPKNIFTVSQAFSSLLNSEHRPKDANGNFKRYSTSSKLPSIRVQNGIGDQVNVHADESPHSTSYESLIDTKQRPLVDAKNQLIGFEMSMPEASRLIGQSIVSKLTANDHNDFYSGKLSSFGIGAQAISNETQALVATHLDKIAASGNVSAIPVNKELLDRGNLPHTFVGKQVDVFKTVEDMCSGIEGRVMNLKKGTIGERIMITPAEMATIKTQLLREIGAGYGALNTDSGNSYVENDIKPLELFEGKTYYGNPETVFSASNDVISNQMVGNKTRVGYNEYPTTQYMIKAPVGKHMIYVPVSSYHDKNRKNRRSMRVGKAFIMNEDGVNYCHTNAHNDTNVVVSSQDGKALAVF